MKLKTLKEARYAGGEKGSLDWFLKNFFSEYQSQEMEGGLQRGYRVNNGFEITGRGRRVIGVDVHPNGEFEWAVLHATHGTTQHTYFPLSDIVVKQTKQLWPQP